ncbi:hypothetical protein [Candidatus Poriferisocius sp.]|uniref:hypothetical protein n=1 Tax=Candidatus Poriferisocius sp. TaxID=3101276 RepID=UPI003B02B23C
MGLEKRPITFEPPDTDAVVHEMLTLAARGDGKGWMNIQPVVADEHRPPESPLFKLFTARGPAIPLGTWVPGHHYRDKWQPASAGLQHAGGRHASELLKERGVAEPSGWNRRQDHIKRGLVYELPESQDPKVALDFLVDAMAQLVGFPLSGRWRATILTQR